MCQVRLKWQSSGKVFLEKRAPAQFLLALSTCERLNMTVLAVLKARRVLLMTLLLNLM
jgi:hypothetical protein